jgi:hypothetical protein
MLSKWRRAGGKASENGVSGVFKVDFLYAKAYQSGQN